ncbi:sialate O-acetylesterase [Rubritalea profundi]|uniref:Sialate O-acetylesterase domain-containing protein n=1 Tax=Rubritalea profundi TaxID=1658618 RepID=A0A2S7TZH2_9BACT|nr:sialate O-acetylesterase [Rubritalea profundi]PQJ28148.1 hypothetical protein BSZ32_06290 [Rubritalea profundi]
MTNILSRSVLTALAITGFAFHPTLVEAKPLKVYILAGQSNMEGHAKVETFDYIGDDPATAPLLKEMRGPDGKPRVSDKVWISYFTGIKDTNGEGIGKLTAGYGARRNPAENGGKIGPEFTFGLTMEKAHDGPVLIIKTAWGGKSLHTDFRPPSAGPYKLNAWQLENYPKQEGHGIPKDFKKWKADKKTATGHYYRLMTEHVQNILTDIKRVYPDYNPKQGFELAGFVWFQGWNDMVDGQTYPRSNKPGRFDLYSELMAHFIRDVRKDFKAPKMPFVIGVMGVDGVQDKPNYFRLAMAAPAALPEFKGNVVAVETAPYWDQPLGDIDQKNAQIRQMGHFLRSKHKGHANKDGKMTKDQQQTYLKDYRAKLITPADEARWKRGASNAGYHYLGCAKTMALIGQAFAQASLQMEKK